MRRIRKSDFARQDKLDRRLYKAVVRGAVDDVKQYLNEGGRLLSYNGPLGSPLHAAVANGHLPVTMLLIEAGAPTNLMGDTSYAPLHLACRHGHLAIVSALIDNNADLNIKSKFEQRTPLHIAARWNELDIAEVLISKKAKVDARDIYGNTPLHIAGRDGYNEFVKFLLASGADTDIYDNDGWTTLHYAANEGYTELIKLLIANHASVDQQNKYGRTPLHWACSAHQVPAVETLLSLGASTLIKDRQGKLPVDTTSDSVIKQIIQLYENNLPSDGAGATTLDLHLTLKPFIRSLSRLESHESRRSGYDEVDSGSSLIDLPTPPDIRNCLKSTFGYDIIELIDDCFGQPDEVAIMERTQTCQKYKQFLMAVGSLMQNSNIQLNTLYSTVAAGLQNKSQIQIIDILKVVFEKVQNIEDNMNDYQREISAALRALTSSIKTITDSCTEYAKVKAGKQGLSSLQLKIDHFLQSALLSDIALIIAKHKDTWRQMLPKLLPDLSDVNIRDLENRIANHSDKESKRALTTLNIWHIPKDIGDSRQDINSEELCQILSELEPTSKLAKEVKDLCDNYEVEGPLIQLVDISPKLQKDVVKKSVSFESQSTTSDLTSTDC